MKKVLLLMLIMSAFSVLTISQSFAVGMNITIPDLIYSSSTGWHGMQEDNEVEPGCLTGQVWDLEAFMLDGLDLTMIGGFDFVNGVPSGSKTFLAGDIFIDVDEDVKYGPSNDGSGANNSTVANSFGYDFVIDIDYTSLSYDVWSIGGSAMVSTVKYSQNQESNPWRYVSGGTFVESGSASYQYYNTDVFGLAGGYHHAITVDIGFLKPYFPSGNIITFHNTMECGNDNLMGAIPEPGTVLLLGMGLLGMGIVGRIRRKK